MQDVRLSCFIRWLEQNLWQFEFQVPRRANIDWMHIGNRLFSSSREKVLSYICLADCLVVYAVVMVLAFFQSAPWFAKRRVAHCWLVSSRMKTDVVLLACHKWSNVLTCKDTQTDLVSDSGWHTVMVMLQIWTHQGPTSPGMEQTLLWFQ